MNYATIIKEIGRGAKGAKPMERAVAEEVFGALLDGDIPDMEVGAILLSPARKRRRAFGTRWIQGRTGCPDQAGNRAGRPQVRITPHL